MITEKEWKKIVETAMQLSCACATCKIVRETYYQDTKRQTEKSSIKK